MVKCEVLVDKVSLVVCKGSIVYVDEKQFELARHLIKPVDMPKAEVQEVEVAEEKPKRTRRTKK